MSAREQPGPREETTITVATEPSLILRVLGVLGCLLPPRMHDNGHKDLVEKVQQYDRRVRRWRERISYAVIFLIFAVAAEVTLSWGLTPKVFNGFEPKIVAMSMAEQTNQRTKRIETQLLEQSLVAAREGECRTNAKRFFTERLTDLMRDYQNLTGQPWPKPDCEELEQ